jgi:sigma-B regulation protein RsbU (phosphoserine phosphatase)
VRRASERQRRLLPSKLPELAGAEVDLVYRPAAVVSGDFYDFVPLPGGRTAFLVGDVSGHGIEAGIVMGMAKKVLQIRLQDLPDPADALARTNDDVDRELGRVSFVTAFVAVFDPADRSLVCLRAGHNPPLLCNPAREGGGVELKPPGMGLGITGGTAFRKALRPERVPVLPGDVLLLYTDGLVEAADGAGEQFGVERIRRVLAAAQGYPPSLVVRQVSDALDGFTGGADSEDDITAVCVRFR